MKNHIISILLLFSSFTFAQTVTDYDGNVYDVVTIGTQKWLKQNLITSHFQNGDEIPLVTDNTTWTGMMSEAMCYYNNDSAGYAPTYGALYNGFVAIDNRNVCPTDWHVSTDHDWKVLEKFVDASVDTTLFDTWTGNTVANHLKEEHSATWHWLTTQINYYGWDTYGFTAMPGGVRTSSTGNFGGVTIYGNWWTDLDVGGGGVIVHFMGAENFGVTRTQRNTWNGYSIRCVQDAGVGLIEQVMPERKLIRVIDLMGREVEPQPNRVLIYQYSDGSSERVFVVE